MAVSLDIQSISTQLERTQREAESFMATLTEDAGTYRQSATSWSAADCFGHLGLFNTMFLSEMEKAAVAARRTGRFRSKPVQPSLLAKLFARFLEPPVRRARFKTLPAVMPQSTSLQEAYRAFIGSHAALRSLLVDSDDLDLARSRFVFPVMRRMKISLMDGFHILAAHERRHLWQAEQVVKGQYMQNGGAKRT